MLVRLVTCPGVTVARPWREDEQQTRVAARAHRVALARIEDRREACAAGLAADVHLAVHDDHVGALVDLVLLQRLAGGELDQDRPRLPPGRVQDLRLMRLDVERAQIPVLHARQRTYCSAASRRRLTAWRMMRDTCICETPMREPISACVRSSSKRSRSTSRSRSLSTRMRRATVAESSASPKPGSSMPTARPIGSPPSSSSSRGRSTDTAREAPAASRASSTSSTVAPARSALPAGVAPPAPPP